MNVVTFEQSELGFTLNGLVTVALNGLYLRENKVYPGSPPRYYHKEHTDVWCCYAEKQWWLQEKRHIGYGTGWARTTEGVLAPWLATGAWEVCYYQPSLHGGKDLIPAEVLLRESGDLEVDAAALGPSGTVTARIAAAIEPYLAEPEGSDLVYAKHYSHDLNMSHFNDDTIELKIPADVIAAVSRTDPIEKLPLKHHGECVGVDFNLFEVRLLICNRDMKIRASAGNCKGHAEYLYRQ